MMKLCTIAAGLALLMISGCDTSDRINRLEKQTDDLKAQVEKDHAALDYDLQAKCSKDARAWFNENWSRDKDTALLDFTNHYHKASNKCFILVEYHYSEPPGGSWVNNISLWNVYENSKYGDFSENHIIDFKSESRTNVIVCEVMDKKCTTLDDFNGLVRPYLNN